MEQTTITAPQGQKTASIDSFLFVTVSEPKRFNSKQRRTGFDKIAFDKSYYVTVTLTDHSEGHGVVKSVILRNPAPQFILAITDPKMWEISKEEVTVVTENGNEAVRTLRVVYLVTPQKKVLMSNGIEEQLLNLAKFTTVRVDGMDEQIIGYRDSTGAIVDIDDSGESRSLENELEDHLENAIADEVRD